MVNNAKNRLINVGIAPAVAGPGAALMMGVDLGGTRWLKFVLYVFFSLSFSSPLFPSSLSCSMLSRSSQRN